MKIIILCLVLIGCAKTQTETDQHNKEKIMDNYMERHYKKLGGCDQKTLDEESAKIGAYEITCEELEDL